MIAINKPSNECKNAPLSRYNFERYIWFEVEFKFLDWHWWFFFRFIRSITYFQFIWRCIDHLMLYCERLIEANSRGDKDLTVSEQEVRQFARSRTKGVELILESGTSLSAQGTAVLGKAPPLRKGKSHAAAMRAVAERHLSSLRGSKHLADGSIPVFQVDIRGRTWWNNGPITYLDSGNISRENHLIKLPGNMMTCMSRCVKRLENCITDLNVLFIRDNLQLSLRYIVHFAP